MQHRQAGERGLAARYAAKLLGDLGRLDAVARLSIAPRHPNEAWAASGLDQCTGRPDGSPLMAPAGLAALADGAMAALAAIGGPGLFGIGGAALIGERARVLGLTRQGAVSPGGGCRLLQAADGWIAASLVREDDWSAAPAWLQTEDAADWDAVSAAVRLLPAASLVERARLLGLAVATALPPEPARGGWFASTRLGALREAAARPKVLDLSSLWAGPLCGRLLRLAGADVVKVESSSRPDGARAGPSEVFARLNAGKRSVALDLRAAAGRAALLALIGTADIIIESARPRALRQLGIEAEALVRERAGLTWISLTGYGRDPPQDQWVAFGDDAAAAAGLAALMAQAYGEPLFCGDAIADPLTGVHAALAGLAAHQAGGGRLVALSLHGVVAHALAADPPGAEGVQARTQRWARELARAGRPSLAPLPPDVGPARTLGADTAEVLREAGFS